ncbi:DUF1501 domain-containing protein [Vibrio nigripulchritudo]|uniref:DUF1501 domain-containing protein n=1 Tax=Vibrio nigripulchritudo TaxID=28173 RepID=UPI0003B1EB65|nr:DUF1501 domain-containing protein [Vibrio nigripulchritudo]CCN68356.1 conserved hypothetical protein [Vibrio nigripulchritudo SFn118]
MKLNRRQFLRSASALSFPALLNSPLVMGAHGDDNKDFKALVCIYLAGGNDGFNTVIPTDEKHYLQYQKARSDLALERNEILPIDLKVKDRGGEAVSLGLHPAMPELQNLIQQGKGNVVLNSGILREPLSKQSINNGQSLPPQLFSHNSQAGEWMKGAVGLSNAYGWAGRMLDVLELGGKIEPSFSLGRETYWLRAQQVQQNVIKIGKITKLRMLDRNRRTRQSFIAMNDKSAESPFHQYLSDVKGQALEKSEYLSDQLAPIADSESLLSIGTLGPQLNSALKLIRLAPNFSHTRQTIFVRLNGFDTHDDQLERHPELLRELSQGIAQFYAELEILGLDSKVTTFTMSDFGRRIAANGKGSDHGWGSHQLIVGGSVQTENAIGVYPDISLKGADDLGVGRIIPTLSNDQVGATLAKWMGVTGTGLDYVFPNLKNFAQHELQFFKS